MLQSNKVLRLERQSWKKLSNLQNANSQMRAYKSVFGQHDLLSIGHNVDLELTLPFLLGTVPWSQSTPDRISTKISKSKLSHGLQSHIEPTLDRPCSAAHNYGRAVTTENNSFSCHSKGLMAPVFNQALKAGHVGFVTDTYIQCISGSL